jgi:hypothetical protein
VKLEQLQQTHPDYAPARWEQIRDLYEGGWSILDDAAKYLPRMVGEREERYQERVKQASYIPYLGMIADAYVAGLFKHDLAVTPQCEDGKAAPDVKVDDFWRDFGSDVDLRGNAFSMLMRDVALNALLYRKALVSVDLPRLDLLPATRAEEDAMGAARAYAFTTCREELVDWQHETRVTRTAEFGQDKKVSWTIGLFRWAVTRRHVVERKTPDQARTRHDEYTVWEMVDGRASFARYRVTEEDAKDKEKDLQPYEKGTTEFTRIPILELEIPPGLWLGNKLGPLALEHFRRRTNLNAAEMRTLVPTPVVYLGSEIPGVSEALPSAVQQDPNRGRNISERMAGQGYLALGEKDRLEFPMPATEGMTLSKERLAELVDEMFRVSHMMAASVSSTSTAAGRSGASKAEDRNSTNVVLSALSFIVRDFAVCIYDFVTLVRKEDTRWVATGCDSFAEVDRATLLEEAGVVGMIAIPSRTFRVEYTKRIAFGLVDDLSPEQQQQIGKEIEDGIKEEDVELAPKVDPLAKGEVPEDEEDDDEDGQPVNPQGKPAAPA